MMAAMLPPLLLILMLLSPPAAWAQAGPHVTTDTPEYCQLLQARLARMPAARQEPAQSLGAEGARLCDQGHTRLGITKLRRAIRAARPAG